MGEKRFKKKQKGKFHPGNYENTSVLSKIQGAFSKNFSKMIAESRK